MRRQERKNAVRLQKMTRHRLRIQQFALTIRSTLHTRIIANNQRKQADRRAGLFRAFLAATLAYLTYFNASLLHRQRALAN